MQTEWAVAISVGRVDAGLRGVAAREALGLYHIDGGPGLTTGGVIALAFRLELAIGDGLAQ